MKVLIFTTFFFFHLISSALALPEGWQVESGDVSFESPDPYTLNINSSDKAVINFNSFDITQNETVNFIQPFSSATVLSRVIGNEASQIFGSLSANGILFLSNPNGIYFAPSSIVQVNTLVASTLDISTNNFINGNYVFEHRDDARYAQILNEGTISGNNVALIGSGVHNSGLILAKAGVVNLASGNKTTVSFDSRGLIQVEINAETSAKVYDLNGVAVKDAIANSGTIEGTQVFMGAKTAEDIFEYAVNQTGIVKATGIVEKDGIIKIVANKNIQVSGTLEAKSGDIEVSSLDSVEVNSELRTFGNTKVIANKDILVNADITTDSGNLELLADNDLDGIGAFKQAKDTTISTINFGDITIQSSGESTLANINSAGDLILKQGGLPATFTQWPDSHITTKGSMIINRGVDLNAEDTQYNIGKDWVSFGNFNPDFSTVSLISDEPAYVTGSNTFYNFSITVPDKIVRFAPEETQTILGTLTLRGEYGRLLVLDSLNPPKQWKILPQGLTDIVYVLIGNSINIRGPPLVGLHSDSQGNLTNWELTIFWTGQGQDNNWSNPSNWSTGRVPSLNSSLLFDGITGLNPNKDSLVDTSFQGTIAYFIINGYTGTITLARDLNITQDITLASGTLSAGSYTITIGGNWTNSGGNFQADTSTVVFNDASKTSNIFGNITFYNFSCTIPDKELYFEPGKTYTFRGSLKLVGAPDGAEEYLIKLRSQKEGQQWYLDIQTDNYILDFLNVRDCYSLTPISIPTGVNGGNNTNINIDPEWDGGGADNNWSTAGNWVGDTVPGTTDAVTFTGDTGLYPNADKDCTIDALGTWSGGTITIGSGYAGTITLTALSMTTGAFSIAGGTFNSNGNTLIMDSYSQTGGIFTAGASSITCKGSFSVTVGTYNANTSTLTLDATSGNLTFTGGGYSFNNVVFTIGATAAANRTVTLGSGTFTISGYFYVDDDDDNNLTVTAATNNPTMNITGDVDYTGTGAGSESISMGSGTWTVSSNVYLTDGTVAAGTSTLVMNGTNVNLSPAYGSELYKVTISGTVNFTTYIIVASTLTVDANKTLTITNTGVLDRPDGSTTTINGTITSSGNGVMRVTDGAGANLSTGGTLTAWVRFNFYLTNSVTIPARTYGGIVDVRDTGTANRTATLGTAAGQTLTFQSHFYVIADSTSNVTVDASVYNPTVNITGNLDFTGTGAGSESISMGSGTWTVSGSTIDFTGGTITAGSSTLVLDGSSTQTLTSASQSLNNLTIKNTSAAGVILSGALSVAGNLYLAADGASNVLLDAATNNVNVTVTGDIDFTGTGAGSESISMGSGTWTVSGSVDFTDGTITAGSSTLVMNGTTKNLIGASQTLNNLTISGTITAATSNLNISGTLTVDATKTLTITTVSLNMRSGSTVTLNGTITGTGSLRITDSASLGTGGTLNTAVDFFADSANVTVPARTYGGGVVITNEGTANRSAIMAAGTHTFSSNLNIRASAGGNMTLDGATNNPTVNITGDLDFTGTGAGTESISMGTGTWTVSGNVDLTGGTVTAGTSTLKMNATATGKTITSAGQSLYNLTFDGSGGGWTLQDNTIVSNNFTVSAGTFDANNYTFSINGNTTIDGGIFKTGTNTITFGNAGADTVTISGGELQIESDDTTSDIVKNAGTWTNSGGTITYNAATAVSTKLRSALSPYNNLTINSSGSTYTLDGAIDVNGNLTITAGTLDTDSTNNYAVTIGGNFSNSGTFNANSSTVTFDATSTGNTINAGGASFYNLTFNGAGGGWTVEGSLTISNLLRLVAGTLSSNALTITGDVILNGTLDAGAYTITINGNLTTDANGIFQGTSPTLSVGGYIGTRNNPINTSITGTLTIYAKGMLDYVSVSIKGTGTYDFREPIPGFVISNGSFLEQIGQQKIRSLLIEGSSGLYAGGAMPLPMMAMMPAVMPVGLAVPVITVAPVIAPLPVPVVPTPAPPVPIAPIPEILPKPSFEGVIPGAILPRPLSFEGVSSTVNLPIPITKETFTGVISKALLPEIIPKPSFEGVIPEAVLPAAVSFEGVSSAVNLPIPITKETFTGVIPKAVLPEIIPKPSFEGIISKELLPSPLPKPSFEGVIPTSALPKPVSPLTFEEVTGEIKVKVMFPGGERIIPTYGVGAPLGVEKPLLEPRIKREEKK